MSVTKLQLHFSSERESFVVKNSEMFRTLALTSAVKCFSGNINSRNGCALSIIFLSNRMLAEASPSLAFCAVPPLHTSRPAARDASSAFNNVIKPPRALWPSPLPCCVRTLPLPSSKEMNGSTPLQPRSSVCTESRCLLHSVLSKPIVTERKGRISASEII